jgi:hypothetical protein
VELIRADEDLRREALQDLAEPADIARLPPTACPCQRLVAVGLEEEDILGLNGDTPAVESGA